VVAIEASMTIRRLSAGNGLGGESAESDASEGNRQC
jgi:hypothetical protein